MPDVELRHGITMDDVDRAARSASRRFGVYRLFGAAELYDQAWSGAVTALYEAEDPTWFTIYRGAVTALTQERDAVLHHIGLRAPKRFDMYWHARVTPFPDDRICERLALAQVLPMLTELERTTLVTLAAHGNVTFAAAALGMATASFHQNRRRAQRKVDTLWYEGETPPPRRRDSRSRDGSSDTVNMRRRHDAQRRRLSRRSELA